MEIHAGERIRKLREEQGISQAELARRAGLSPQYVSDIENGRTNPSLKSLRKLAAALGSEVPWLLSERPTIYPEGVVEVPVIGEVPAGGPAYREEDIIGYLPLPLRFAGNDYICLLVRGDSMEGVGIYDGDYVLVRLQPDAESGQTVIARVEGEVTCKRLYKLNGKVRLEPASDKYRPIEARQIEIIGVVKKVIRDV